MEKKYLFVTGPMDSGLVELWKVLKAHPSIALGQNRYTLRTYSQDILTPDLFDEARFFDVLEGDTFVDTLSELHPTYYENLRERYDDCLYFGDTVPLLYRRFEEIAQQFDDVTVIMPFRNIFDQVAVYLKKFQDPNNRFNFDMAGALQHWSVSIRWAEAPPPGINVIVVPYEKLFLEGEGLNDLFNRLGLPVSQHVLDVYDMVRQGLHEKQNAIDNAASTEEVQQICLEAPFKRYEALMTSKLAL